MRGLLALLLSLLANWSAGQSYSTFYGRYDVQSTITQDVNVSGNLNVNKTVKTIDYGALAEANALKEQNRIERLKLTQQFEARILMAIADDPRKAFDYGENQVWKLPKATREVMGWAKPTKTWSHRQPHESLFFRRENMGGYFYENRSSDGIVTTVQFLFPASVQQLIADSANFNRDIEAWMKYSEIGVGEVGVVSVGDATTPRREAFVHDKATRRVNVAGFSGYSGKLVFEDDYEITIRDDFMSIGNVSGTEYLFFVQVHTKAGKGDVSFEDLEGRRHYLSGLVYELTSRWSIQ
jgi:hypothetical protein